MDDFSFVKRGLLLGLAWVNGQLHEFAIPSVRPGSFSKQDVARIKPISELALTIWVLKRCGIKIPILDKITEWLWHQCDYGQDLTHLLLARNDFLPSCALVAPLYQLGYRSSTLQAVLKMLSKSDMVTVLPLQPWSRLALEYNLWKLGLLRQLDIRQSGLYIESCPEPWVVSGEIAYAITHEILYLSDFGFRPLHNVRVLTYLRTWIPYWSEIFSHEQDYDLTGEFAMVWNCIGEQLQARHKQPLITVLENQQRDGSVAGPKGAGSFLFSDGDSPSQRHFLACYHTTLVLLMATAMSLRAFGQSNL